MVNPYRETQLNKRRGELILSFYRGMQLFRNSFDEKGRHKLTYHRLDYLIESYFRTVKDLSHQIFHLSERSGHAHALQVTFDLSFGIVFHLLLKLKETLRLAENYSLERLRSMVDRLERSPNGDLAAMTQLFDSLRIDYERDLLTMDEELARARDALDDIEQVFNKIIAVYAGNATILRTLHANHSLFLKLFPGDGVDHLFRSLYPREGPAMAYIALGFDYLRSGHLALAARVFRRATRSADAGSPWAGVDTQALYQQARQKYLDETGLAAPDVERRRAALAQVESGKAISFSPPAETADC